MENYSSLLNLLSGFDSSQAEGTSGLSSMFGGNRKLLIWVILFLVFYSCYCNGRGYGYGNNNCCCDYDYDGCCCGKHRKHKSKDCCCIELDPYCLCNGGYNNNGYGRGLLGGIGNGCGINICTIAILAAIYLVRKGC